METSRKRVCSVQSSIHVCMQCIDVCMYHENLIFVNVYDITKVALSSINNSSQTAFCETGMPQTTTKQTDSHIDNIQ